MSENDAVRDREREALAVAAAAALSEEMEWNRDAEGGLREKGILKRKRGKGHETNREESESRVVLLKSASDRIGDFTRILSPDHAASYFASDAG